MGILNVTPDSFSDGGKFATRERAIERGEQLAAAGADVVDIGGESTRPGAERVPPAEQKRRVLDVIAHLRARAPTLGISIDTSSSEVAAAALDAGADLINDVTAGRADPDMLALAGQRDVPFVLMHMQGQPATMQDAPTYDNVVVEVRAFFEARIAAACAAGVARERIILDPGIGFGKRRAHNLSLLAGLEEFASMGYPLMLGLSRKGFLGNLLATREPLELIPATCAANALGVLAGARIFRVHDVSENRQALTVAWKVLQAQRART